MKDIELDIDPRIFEEYESLLELVEKRNINSPKDTIFFVFIFPPLKLEMPNWNFKINHLISLI